MDESEDDLPALFQDHVPDKLSSDMLALAHLSDVEEESLEVGPVRRVRTKRSANPYGMKAKSEQENLDDEIKELDFRTRAWKPFRNVKGEKQKQTQKSDI
jgi:hypothetical protein